MRVAEPTSQRLSEDGTRVRIPAPYFICIGSQKAGTDWVYDQFSAHEAFEMPPLKELHFFNKQFGPRRQRQAVQRLRSLAAGERAGPAKLRKIRFLAEILNPDLPDASDIIGYARMFWRYTEKFSGDVCPGYIHLPAEQIAQIAETLTRTRFMVILRDPIDRIWSQVLMHERLGRQPNHPPEVSDTVEGFRTFLGVQGVDKLSFIAGHVANWKRIMGDRIGVYFFDDLREDPLALRDRVSAFLKVDPTGFDLEAGFNKKASQPGKRPIPNAVLGEATRVFAQEYRDLADTVGGRAIEWRDRNEARLKELG